MGEKFEKNLIKIMNKIIKTLIKYVLGKTKIAIYYYKNFKNINKRK